jgi:hypothetical protein
MRSWEGSGLQDTPENRRLLEAAALVISSETKNGTFDYLRHFPKGNKARLFRPTDDLSPSHVTVETYFKGWIKKQAERVRARRVKDYDAIRRHVLKSSSWPTGVRKARSRSAQRLAPPELTIQAQG